MDFGVGWFVSLFERLEIVNQFWNSVISPKTNRRSRRRGCKNSEFSQKRSHRSLCRVALTRCTRDARRVLSKQVYYYVSPPFKALMITLINITLQRSRDATDIESFCWPAIKKKTQTHTQRPTDFIRTIFRHDLCNSFPLRPKHNELVVVLVVFVVRVCAKMCVCKPRLVRRCFVLVSANIYFVARSVLIYFIRITRP